MSTHTTEIVHQPTTGYTDLSTDSFKKCLEFGKGILYIEYNGGILSRGFCPGGFCPGGFVLGGFCPGGFVRGDFVLESCSHSPYKVKLVTWHVDYMY